jgi:ArsR family transcriptional regulator, arsenate/arsenite/antimonite-responsive transcriptional repressor
MFFRAIHDRHRHTILDVIQHHKKINENGIVKEIPLSQPTISHHLKILCEAGIVHAKKTGKEVIYSINEQSIHECCGGFMHKFTHQI